MFIILSNTRHEKPCVNLGGPSSKAKYSLVTDSEQVPWGKGEKNPYEGSEIESETIYLQSVEGLCSAVRWKMANRVPFA